MLLTIKNPAELKLTLLVLARACRTGDPCPAITYADFRSATGLSPTTIAQGLKDMNARGYIRQKTSKRKEPARYQVLWDRLGISVNQPDTVTASAANCPPNSLSLSTAELYFTDTGFLDLLPQAKAIAREFGYDEDDMIEAICMVFDKQRDFPPTANRTSWFTTVFREKIQEAHAKILAHKRRKSRELEESTI